MNRIPLKIKQDIQLVCTQRGTTLIEILVSMFILALGIMALVSMQVRTSAGLREAENQSVINQAIQTFAEGMRINPAFGTPKSSSKAAAKSYAAYEIKPGGCDSILNSHPASSASSASSLITSTGVVSSDQLATYQKVLLCQNIKKVPGITNFLLQVCTNSSIQPKINSIPASGQSVCKPVSGLAGNGQTIVTAVWSMKSFTDFGKGKKPSVQQSDDSGISDTGDSITYSYQLPLGQ